MLNQRTLLADSISHLIQDKFQIYVSHNSTPVTSNRPSKEIRQYESNIKNEEFFKLQKDILDCIEYIKHDLTGINKHLYSYLDQYKFHYIFINNSYYNVYNLLKTIESL